jgi:hypothetical protein
MTLLEMSVREKPGRDEKFCETITVARNRIRRVLSSANLQERNLVMRAAFAIVVCSLATVACDGSSYPTSPEPANPFAKGECHHAGVAYGLRVLLRWNAVDRVQPHAICDSFAGKSICRRRDDSSRRRFESERRVDHFPARRTRRAIRIDLYPRRQQPFVPFPSDIRLPGASSACDRRRRCPGGRGGPAAVGVDDGLAAVTNGASRDADDSHGCRSAQLRRSRVANRSRRG